MVRQEDRRVEVRVNKSLRRVEMAILTTNGSNLADINFTLEQAMQHIKHMQIAVDMITGQTPGGIIVPEGVKVQ